MLHSCMFNSPRVWFASILLLILYENNKIICKPFPKKTWWATIWDPGHHKYRCPVTRERVYVGSRLQVEVQSASSKLGEDGNETKKTSVGRQSV